MPTIENEGDFIARITRREVKPMETSRAVALYAEFTAFHFFDETNGTWIELTAPYTTTGDFFVIGKEGAINEAKVREVKTATGWNGDLVEWVDPNWTPHDVRITVKAEKGRDNRTYFKVAWINDRDSPPGRTVKAANLDAIRSLNLQFGASLRRVGGKGAPPPPPRPASPATAETNRSEEDPTAKPGEAPWWDDPK